MGKKNNKTGAQPMSPEKYIKEKARMLPPVSYTHLERGFHQGEQCGLHHYLER